MRALVRRNVWILVTCIIGVMLLIMACSLIRVPPRYAIEIWEAVLISEDKVPAYTVTGLMVRPLAKSEGPLSIRATRLIDTRRSGPRTSVGSTRWAVWSYEMEVSGQIMTLHLYVEGRTVIASRLSGGSIAMRRWLRRSLFSELVQVTNDGGHTGSGDTR